MANDPMANDPNVDDLIGRVYDAVGDEGRWTTLLGILASKLSAQSAALVIHDVRPESHGLAASWNINPEASQLYGVHYGAVDIWALRGSSKAAGCVYLSEQLCSLEELATTEIYNEFLLPQDITHGIFGLCANVPQRWGTISFYKGSSAKEFRSADQRFLQFLLSHIRRAFVMHLNLCDLTTRSEAAEKLLNMLSPGIILLRKTGEVAFVNESARKLLKRNDGLFFGSGGLRAAKHSESLGLQAMISQALQIRNNKGLGWGDAILISRKEGRQLEVTVASLRIATVLDQEPIVIVVIDDPDRRLNIPEHLLRRRYGLTAAEARLATTLLGGGSLKEVADSCGVTHNTARSQLKNVFGKTDVKRQSELIKLLLNSFGALQISSLENEVTKR